MINSAKISYQFHLPKAQTIEYIFEFNGERFVLQRKKVQPPPWAELHCQQCRHCPYKEGSGPKHCPAASQLSMVVADLDVLASFEEIQVRIQCGDRIVKQAIGSLLGLLLACSGCPHTEFLLPMARFHLPLASAEETLWRASSSFLLAQYFRLQNGKKAEGLEGLTRRYENLEVLNTAMVKRLRNQVDTDSCLNAIVLLDNYAKMYPHFLERSLQELKPLYQGYLQS